MLSVQLIKWQARTGALGKPGEGFYMAIQISAQPAHARGIIVN